jgi:hypothetical protein
MAKLKKFIKKSESFTPYQEKNIATQMYSKNVCTEKVIP